MVIGSKPKGLQSIRSMSDLVTETSNPQRKFLKLAVLAMEKVRRGKERASAKQRVENIDGRLVEIEAETKDLLQLCNASGSSKLSDAPTSPKKASPRRVRGGIKLRY
mgnify:CR=1 FL=1